MMTAISFVFEGDGTDESLSANQTAIHFDAIVAEVWTRRYAFSMSTSVSRMREDGFW